jgi:hypothetical protein
MQYGREAEPPVDSAAAGVRPAAVAEETVAAAVAATAVPPPKGSLSVSRTGSPQSEMQSAAASRSSMPLGPADAVPVAVEMLKLEAAALPDNSATTRTTAVPSSQQARPTASEASLMPEDLLAANAQPAVLPVLDDPQPSETGALGPAALAGQPLEQCILPAEYAPDGATAISVNLAVSQEDAAVGVQQPIPHQKSNAAARAVEMAAQQATPAGAEFTALPPGAMTAVTTITRALFRGATVHQGPAGPCDKPQVAKSAVVHLTEASAQSIYVPAPTTALLAAASDMAMATDGGAAETGTSPGVAASAGRLSIERGALLPCTGDSASGEAAAAAQPPNTVNEAVAGGCVAQSGTAKPMREENEGAQGGGHVTPVKLQSAAGDGTTEPPANAEADRGGPPALPRQTDTSQELLAPLPATALRAAVSATPAEPAPDTSSPSSAVASALDPAPGLTPRPQPALAGRVVGERHAAAIPREAAPRPPADGREDICTIWGLLEQPLVSRVPAGSRCPASVPDALAGLGSGVPKAAATPVPAKRIRVPADNSVLPPRKAWASFRVHTPAAPRASMPTGAQHVVLDHGFAATQRTFLPGSSAPEAPAITGAGASPSGCKPAAIQSTPTASGGMHAVAAGTPAPNDPLPSKGTLGDLFASLAGSGSGSSDDEDEGVGSVTRLLKPDNFSPKSLR